MIEILEKGVNMFKVNNKNTRTMSITSSGVSIVNFQNISHVFLVSFFDLQLVNVTWANNLPEMSKSCVDIICEFPEKDRWCICNNCAKEDSVTNDFIYIK